MTAENKNGSLSTDISTITNLYAGNIIPAATTSGTDTTGIASQVWITAINIPYNMTITGISYLIGSTGGTDKAIAILFDYLGRVVAYSAIAGTTVGTTATFQRLPFTAAYSATPGLYFIGIQTNGTTAKIRTQVFGEHPTAIATQVFGTPANIPVPTTFTTAYGPTCLTY